MVASQGYSLRLFSMSKITAAAMAIANAKPNNNAFSAIWLSSPVVGISVDTSGIFGLLLSSTCGANIS